jgi:nucleoside-diphosphate-sugar epimerase
MPDTYIIGKDDPILVTGATGFIGGRLVANLIERGFQNIRCFSRPSGNAAKLEALRDRLPASVRIEVIRGNLLSRDDCVKAATDVAVIYHLAAGRGEKSFPDAFMNSVVTTRNLLEAASHHTNLKRFVSISSFAVYSNQDKPGGNVLDEMAPMETRPELRGDAYSFAKVKQDELVIDYGKRCGVPYVIVRPGVVYGPGNPGIHGRIGLGSFGIFLHLGGSNPIPLTYVDNCADAIVLAGLVPGVDGEVFNVVDDDLPSSRCFLRMYKKKVRRFSSIYVPHALSYFLCYLWEKYADWSEGQLPSAYNRKVWHAAWKRTRYTNKKLKRELSWKPAVKTADGLVSHFESCRQRTQEKHA